MYKRTRSFTPPSRIESCPLCYVVLVFALGSSRLIKICYTIVYCERKPSVVKILFLKRKFVVAKLRKETVGFEGFVNKQDSLKNRRSKIVYVRHSVIYEYPNMKFKKKGISKLPNLKRKSRHASRYLHEMYINNSIFFNPNSTYTELVPDLSPTFQFIVTNKRETRFNPPRNPQTINYHAQNFASLPFTSLIVLVMNASRRTPPTCLHVVVHQLCQFLGKKKKKKKTSRPINERRANRAVCNEHAGIKNLIGNSISRL